MYTLTKSLLCFSCFVSYMLPYRRPGRRVMSSLLVRSLEYVIFFKKNKACFVLCSGETLFLRRFVYLMYMVIYAHGCPCTTRLPDAHSVQKWAQGFLELDLRTVVSCLVGSDN